MMLSSQKGCVVRMLQGSERIRWYNPDLEESLEEPDG